MCIVVAGDFVNAGDISIEIAQTVAPGIVESVYLGDTFNSLTWRIDFLPSVTRDQRVAVAVILQRIAADLPNVCAKGR